MISVIKHALMITSFVAVMMLVIEYLNVLSRGEWQERISKRPWGQYLLAAFLGATPGCLGAFAVVSMYVHRRLSLGAVVAAMIATSGDESFVLFAMVPRTAFLLTGLLFAIGIATGALTDLLLKNRKDAVLFSCGHNMVVHEEIRCRCYNRHHIAEQWKNCSPTRGTLALALLLFLFALVIGQIGPPQWNWIRITLLSTAACALFIVATVPDHFLEDHLWKHVVRQHVPRVFAWTFGALLIMHFLIDRWQLADALSSGEWVVLGAAGLIGIVPESGPHLIFTTLYAKGLASFSVLLTSSIVQDGHGMLPLLAHSRRAFLIIKLINLLVGLSIGALLMATGH